MKLPTRRGRRGVSLVEMVSMFTVAAVVLGSTSALMTRIWNVERSMRAELEQERALRGLAERFRDDVRGARDLAAADDETAWRLAFAGERAVEYRTVADSLQRLTFSGEVVEAREEFTLPAGARVECVVDSAHGWQLVRLTLTAPAASTGGIARPLELHVEALLAKDHRFAHSLEEEMP